MVKTGCVANNRQAIKWPIFLLLMTICAVAHDTDLVHNALITDEVGEVGDGVLAVEHGVGRAADQFLVLLHRHGQLLTGPGDADLVVHALRQQLFRHARHVQSETHRRKSMHLFTVHSVQFRRPELTLGHMASLCV